MTFCGATSVLPVAAMLRVAIVVLAVAALHWIEDVQLPRRLRVAVVMLAVATSVATVATALLRIEKLVLRHELRRSG